MAVLEDTSSLYRFADLTLDAATRRVGRRGRALELSPLNFDLLRALVDAAPEAVTYDQLVQKVWRRSFVSPENIAQRVMLLRQALGDDAERPRYIETQRNRGYRLVPEVVRVPRGTARRRRYAVAGAALALGGAMGAGVFLWTTGAAPPAPALGNGSTEANDFYVRALAVDGAGAGGKALRLRLLNAALDVDPSYADAYALRAQVHAYSIVDSSSGTAVVDSAAAYAATVVDAKRALELDPGNRRAHLALGVANLWGWRWNDAAAHYEAAYRGGGLLEDFSYLTLLSMTGRHREAVAIAERALAANPGVPQLLRNLALVHAYAGEPAAAAEYFRQASLIAPGDGMIRHWLGQMQSILGDADSALANLRVADQLSVTLPANPTLLTGLMYSYSRIGRADDVARLFKELQLLAESQPVGAGTWALAHLARGDVPEARRWLETLVDKVERGEPDAGALNVLMLKTNVHSDPVLESPPFQRLRARISAAGTR